MSRAPIKPLPSAEFLHECFIYEESTGLLFWKKRPLTHFEREREFPEYSVERECKRWNTRYAGTEAFGTIDPVEGYKSGNLYKVTYKAHRVIWKMKTDAEPPDVIDHEDRNRVNNRWGNLRSSDESKNQMNKKGWGATSKHIGVRQRNGRWQARIHRDGKAFDLGWHDSEALAVAAYTAKAKELYGEFATC